MNRTCPACSARLDQQASTCPHCGANLDAGATMRPRPPKWTRRSATPRWPCTCRPLRGWSCPFGSVIGPLAVWLTRRYRDPFIDDAGREALNFGISIAVYGVVALVAALMLVGIPLLVVGVIAWVVLGSLAAVKASQGQTYRYPLTMRLVR
jgi:uncharacterized protein